MVNFSRLDSVKVLKPGSEKFNELSGGKNKVTCYDLTVDGHPSFAVGHQGLIVHNCVDKDLSSDYNDHIYQHLKISNEKILEYDDDILSLLDFPQSHLHYKNCWIGADIGYCADTKTEIFTNRGWLRYDQLDLNDLTLGINPETGQSEWQKVTSIYSEHFDTIPMVKMKGQSFDALVTPHHKWLTRGETGEYRWRETRTLNTKDRIPLTVPRNDIPTVKKYDDDFVELVAWFWTEGWWISKTSAGISQSNKINPLYVERIMGMLSRLLGEPGRAYHPGTRNIAHFWSANHRKDGCIDFHFRGPLVGELKKVTDINKVPAMSFLSTLTTSQLDLFIETSIDADGWRLGSGAKKIEQRSESGIKSFELACALAGYATSTSHDPKRDRYHLSILTSNTVNPISASRKSTTSDQAMTMDKVSYSGTIWCPTVTYGNWLARRNGSVYFTGNTRDPTEILVFAEETDKKVKSTLRLISRVSLDRVAHEHQVATILWLINFYKPKTFALDKTGLGLPLFQDIQNRAKNDQAIKQFLNIIKGYNFSEKILVDFDDSVQVDEFRGDREKEAGLKRLVLEYSTDVLRDLVDSKRLILPISDKQLIGEFQGQTYVYDKSTMDMYGRRRVFSSGTFHALDAARMAATGWAQFSIDEIVKKETFKPTSMVFVG